MVWTEKEKQEEKQEGRKGMGRRDRKGTKHAETYERVKDRIKETILKRGGRHKGGTNKRKDK